MILDSHECDCTADMGENDCADEAGPEELLNKIHEAESLLQTADLCFHDVEGIGKLKNKLKAELRFLNDVSCLKGFIA